MSNFVSNNNKRRWVYDATVGSQGSSTYDSKSAAAVSKSPIPMIAATNAAVASSSGAAANTNNEVLMNKKGWEVAKSPAKSIFMTGFLLWMIGSGISIFTMPVIIYSVINPIKAIFQTNNLFSRFKGNETLQMKITYIAIQLGLLAVALYKCSSMGLLPITPSDWISSLPLKINLDFSSGSFVN
ncbi:DUF1077 family protein [Heterostelium album PN500]|uniref:ER membrane protein complex subunit 4 n=1 Tax=Heterostelium pallidum (strain ATCC 26659 / Pp 5 / PN500) TaxID=670386 RepID=D3AXS1_HETP5|nr:DUF1077 family protein [Heterostelium album PN500]EFA85748.1 DUF1077 family protein [Heterostelium album PN500]|eukprot:XP_020437854.1 DUF1077 family protein [Heterostelium album PN500]